MRETFEYLATFARFPFALRRYLKNPLTITDARRIIAERLAHREGNFLGILDRSVYANPASPYLALLHAAGCERGDVESLIRQEGLDGALEKLRAVGVYVTYDEFRGRTPIVRGSTTIAVTADDFNNQQARRDFNMTTGGSSGLALAVHQDLDNLAANCVHQMLMLDAWGVLTVRAVHWGPILPGSTLRFILQRARFGVAPAGWFSQHGWFDHRSWLKYDLATLYSILWMNAFGVPVPMPRIAKHDEGLAVARALRRALDEYGRCLAHTFVSSGVRIALAAREAGIDLSGTTMRVGGEPVTPSRVATIESVGARVMPGYGSIETGSIGIGCPAGEVGTVHVVRDAIVLDSRPHRLSSGQTVNAFTLTSLLDTSPKVLINYQIGDHGALESQPCGCPLHALGYTTLVRDIRSYSKFLTEGVTFSGVDMQTILEQTLPARFGGTALDYQLLEREEDNGVSRVYLVISPRVTIEDSREPGRVLLAAVRASSARGDATVNIWEQSDSVAVLRQEPTSTSGGKQLVVQRAYSGDSAAKR